MICKVWWWVWCWVTFRITQCKPSYQMSLLNMSVKIVTSAELKKITICHICPPTQLVKQIWGQIGPKLYYWSLKCWVILGGFFLYSVAIQYVFTKFTYFSLKMYTMQRCITEFLPVKKKLFPLTLAQAECIWSPNSG